MTNQPWKHYRTAVNQWHSPPSTIDAKSCRFIGHSHVAPTGKLQTPRSFQTVERSISWSVKEKNGEEKKKVYLHCVTFNSCDNGFWKGKTSGAHRPNVKVYPAIARFGRGWGKNVVKRFQICTCTKCTIFPVQNRALRVLILFKGDECSVKRKGSFTVNGISWARSVNYQSPYLFRRRLEHFYIRHVKKMPSSGESFQLRFATQSKIIGGNKIFFDKFWKLPLHTLGVNQ